MHLFTDADNTLWDTDAVFANAQLGMLRDIEIATGSYSPATDDLGLGFLRRIDQRLATLHPDSLRYPPLLLAKGIERALSGVNDAEATTLEAADHARFGEIVARYTERLREVPVLREGVRGGLAALRKADVPVTVVTETTRKRCEDLLTTHGLASAIDQIVAEPKSTELYRRLRQQHVGHLRPVMVGDQMDRDIAYAHAVGYTTVLFPSAFAPYWLADVQIEPDHRISRYDDVLRYVGLALTRKLRAASR